jgi:hypothetical protein
VFSDFRGVNICKESESIKEDEHKYSSDIEPTGLEL